MTKRIHRQPLPVAALKAGSVNTEPQPQDTAKQRWVKRNMGNNFLTKNAAFLHKVSREFFKDKLKHMKKF